MHGICRRACERERNVQGRDHSLLLSPIGERNLREFKEGISEELGLHKVGSSRVKRYMLQVGGPKSRTATHQGVKKDRECERVGKRLGRGPAANCSVTHGPVTKKD